MKIKRKGPDKVRITCTNAEAQAIACLLNTSCTLNALTAIWPRTFYGDPYSVNTPHEQFRKAGIDGSEIATGKKLKPSGNPETFSSSCALTYLIGKWFKSYTPPTVAYPIPVESTKNLPVSAGEREVQRNLKAFRRRVARSKFRAKTRKLAAIAREKSCR